mgnify:CR=1 FL=1
MRTIVHLSDIHFGRVDPRLLAPLIHTIGAIAPDLVAISGDLTQRARRAQFRQARAFLGQLPFRTLVVPGNHDVPLFNLAARFVDPFGGSRRHLTDTLEPVGSHSFGIRYGSLTWVDWKDGHWWMVFANYDKPYGTNKTPCGHKLNTKMVEFTPDFQALAAWTLPKELLYRFEDMINSGGHRGPEG